MEVIEPLIQNSIDHGGDVELIINVETKHDPETNTTTLVIIDNVPEFFRTYRKDESGVKKLFLENVSTKTEGQSSGYGCYIAYEISKQRCGWSIDVENLDVGGCKFTIVIPHSD